MDRILKCIAVDDEPIALEIIRAHAQKLPHLQLLNTFISTTEAISYLQHQPIDLIFLDINMPNMSGLEFAQVVGTRSKIIFTTAHPQFAINGFDLGATDYLLKPINFSRFLQAFNRVMELPNNYPSAISSNGQNYIFLKTGYDWEKIDLAELLYIEADDNYLTFYTAHKKVLTRMTLTEALKKLPATEFIKVHKSYIVAVSKLEKIERHQILVKGKTIPLSASFRDTLLQQLE